MKEEQQTLIVAAEQVAPNFRKTLLCHLSKLAFAGKSSNEACFGSAKASASADRFSFSSPDADTCSYAVTAYKGLLRVDNALRKIAQYTSKGMSDKNVALSQPSFKQTLFYHLAKLSLIDSSLRHSLPAKLSPFVKIKNQDQDPLHELRQQLIDSWQKNGVPMPLLSKTLFEQLILEAAISNQTPTYTPHGQKPPLLVKTLYHLLSIALITSSVHSYAVPAVNALPGGASISAGSASISSQGNQMIINQASDKLAINWSSYNIGANASVTYQQPSRQSVALNRVSSADPSQIYGNLNANGQIILINPNGVVVGPGAKVNVGAMIVSTMDLSDSDFMAGNYHFTTPSADSLSVLTPQIINQGSMVAAAGGYVHLVGHNIQNQGTISAPGGTVGLLAGDTVAMNLSSNGNLIPASLTAAANADAVINNSGTISADQGSIQLSAVNAGVSGNDINTNPLANTVVIDQSGSLNSAGGTILVDGGTTGIVQHSGTLSTVNANGIGGNITVLGDEVGLMANSVIDASGSQGGGTVLIGGNWHGAGPEHNASAVYMDPLATVKADASDNGNGGQVVLWSNNYTGFYGVISAKGGSQGGDGGQVETSAQDNLQAIGSVNTSALLGKGGTWLLDPADVTITNAADANISITCTPNCITPSTSTFTPTATPATANVTEINNSLRAGTSVTVTTANGFASTISNGVGHLYLNSPINVSGAASTTTATLTLVGNLDITLNADITASGNNKLNLILNALGANTPEQTSATTVGAGPVIAKNNIDTNGGNLDFYSGVQINATVINFKTNGGTMEFHSAVLVANNPGVTLDAGAGNIKFDSTLDSGNQYSYVLYGSGTGQDNIATPSWVNAYLAAIAKSPCLSAAANNCSLNADGSIDTTKIGASYLAVIGSAFENGLAGAAAGFQRSWLGGAMVLTSTLNVTCSSSSTCAWTAGTAPVPNFDSNSSPTAGQYIWTAGPLLGKAFFQQTIGGSSGNVKNSAYTNWNPGEPNNYPSNTTDVNGEWALQFVGTGGLWNNLNGAYNVGGTNWPLGYVVETNLAPSALKVNANNVTFSGAVGSIKPLSTLTVTAPTINVNGGSIITTGAQTYSATGSSANLNLGSNSTELRVISQVIPTGGAGSGYSCSSASGCLTGGTLSLDNVNIKYDGLVNGAGTLVLHAFNDVILGQQATISATNNKLDIKIESGDNSLDSNAATTGAANATGGAIALSSGSSINTNQGGLLLGGPGVLLSATSCTGTGAGGNATCAQNSNAFNTAVNIGGMIASSVDNSGTGITNTTVTTDKGGPAVSTVGGALTILGSSASNTGAGVNISGSSSLASSIAAIHIIGNASNGATGIVILPVTVSSVTGTPAIGNGGTGTINLIADSMNFGLPTTSTLTGAGVLNLLPYTALTNINLGIAGAVTDLNIPSSAFSGTHRAFSAGLTNINVGGSFVIATSQYPNSGNITLDTLSYGNPLMVNTSGNIVLGNAINYDGLNSTNGGNLFLNNATTGSNTSHNISGSGSLSGGQMITVNTDGSGIYSGTITGTGTALTKIASGTLNLTGSSSYTGVTTISAGTLIASNANALGGASTEGATISGGTLTLNNITLASGSGNPSTVGAVGAVKLDSGTLNSIGVAGISGPLNINQTTTINNLGISLANQTTGSCTALTCSLALGVINIAANKTLTLGDGSLWALSNGKIDPTGASLVVKTSSSYTANGNIGSTTPSDILYPSLLKPPTLAVIISAHENQPNRPRETSIREASSYRAR